MTRPLRSSSDASAGYTGLERAVFQALADELAPQVPDLARQVAASRPTVRKNSGFGVFTELSPSPSWGGGGSGGAASTTTAAQPPGWGTPEAATTLSGDLGSVHAVLAGLRDPVRFTARLQHGRLVGLMGDSYGQDTRHIDFATAHFSQLFTVDPSGRSIPLEPLERPLDLDRRVPPRRYEPAPPPVAAAPARVVRLPATPAPAPRPERPDPSSAAGDLLGLVFGAKQTASPAPSVEPTPADRASLLVGLWVVLGVGVFLAELLFDIPWLIAAVAAIWIGLALSKPKGLAALQKGLDAWTAARADR